MCSKLGIAGLVAGAMLATSAQASTTLLSPEWAAQACDAWNKDPILTKELVKSKWASNDGGHGYKAIQIYRNDCENSAWVELQIAQKGELAQCIYGGKIKTTKLTSGVDYVMNASTQNWVEMGKGEYGPMKAMMTTRLRFKGPMIEAMNNMVPFESFLLLVGKVEADASTCPTSAQAKSGLPGL
ncbi:SCP2 sterol-binding domain-containing protein [Stenotrophobium rhamnosiphilum]|uniref:Sterol-binding protein n=1 Tax=Stenotrophobium rhamnosiphilum TaxID=2029166 RepID=A0A2T5MBP9_9GAMM|nr:SCP2 sterol-binding domain-containing protein [Stenotrophobium rhamnosiphilum]PTU29171.1 sterol-binding protein [Stenotrophobium rhamnosiphilum]